MNEKILIESNNDYAKKLMGISTKLLAASLIIAFLLFFFFNDSAFTPIMILDIGFFVVSLCLFIFSIAIQKTKICVTNKRVYGAAMFGKQVDLPFDSISAVGISMFNGISIGTSSGRIVFKGIGNRNDIYQKISELLIDRQTKATTVSQQAPSPEKDETDQLKKFKELLDSGIITQEEFDAKKKQLLGL